MGTRTHTLTDAEGTVTVTQLDVEWDRLRALRNDELAKTDHWALQDRVMTDEQISYRAMLRELPQDHEGENGNQAMDAWDAYEKPED
jgi:hypothetical protein|tara:strand:- start:98 stop:358 length:261 start_codon:yes stop_codon:yes gene_type:complete